MPVFTIEANASRLIVCPFDLKAGETVSFTPSRPGQTWTVKGSTCGPGGHGAENGSYGRDGCITLSRSPSRADILHVDYRAAFLDDVGPVEIPGPGVVRLGPHRSQPGEGHADTHGFIELTATVR